MLTGLYLPTSDLQFFLNRGFTLADLSSSGTSPFVIDILIIYVVGNFKTGAPSFTNLAEILSNPVLFYEFREPNSFETNSSLTVCSLKTLLLEFLIL